MNKKEFKQIIQKLSYTRHTWNVWQDWTQMYALAIAQSTGFTEKREQQYMDIVGRYTHDEMQLFPQLSALTVEALELEFCDFLGSMFMELELGSNAKGQFFTPYHLCKMMAQMTTSNDQYEDGKIVTVSDPCVGGGAMLIALCDTLKEQGINYQRQLRITAQDVDYTACCMCYIQLSLLGCQAKVVYGNTLTVECREQFITPMAAFMGVSG